ncbi:MAG: hypothetical protein ACYCQJ_07495 [Nitrososphaerales archaeon]
MKRKLLAGIIFAVIVSSLLLIGFSNTGSHSVEILAPNPGYLPRHVAAPQQPPPYQQPSEPASLANTPKSVSAPAVPLSGIGVVSVLIGATLFGMYADILKEEEEIAAPKKPTRHGRTYRALMWLKSWISLKIKETIIHPYEEVDA